MAAAAERDPGRGEPGSGRSEVRRRGPHPLAAVALSAVWPGLGHFGHTNGRALLLSTASLAVAVVGLAYFLTRDVRTWLLWSVTRPSLQALIAATLGVLVFRWVVAFDAYRTAARRYPPRRSSTPRRPGTPVTPSDPDGERVGAGARSTPGRPGTPVTPPSASGTPTSSRDLSIPRRLGALVTLMALALLMAAPHLIVVRLAAAQLTLLSDVFDAADTQTARPTPVPTTATAVAPTPDPTTAAGAPTPDPTARLPALAPATTAQATTGSPDAAPQTGAAPPTTAQATTGSPNAAPQTGAAPATTAQATTWDGADRLTIALLGSDAGYRRYGVRTDTIIVLSIDVATGDAAAFNIPRNWSRVTFPEVTAAAHQWPDGYPGIANEIYGLGLRYPDAFPDVEDKAGPRHQVSAGPVDRPCHPILCDGRHGGIRQGH